MARILLTLHGSTDDKPNRFLSLPRVPVAGDVIHPEQGNAHYEVRLVVLTPYRNEEETVDAEVYAIPIPDAEALFKQRCV